MSKRILVLALCLGLAAAVGLGAAQKDKTASAKTKAVEKRPQVDVKTLDPQYQDFLKLVAYIITEKEKEVFLQLTSNRDRDIFIDSFWKIRDPTPGTPENEYKEEINRRFTHVNKKFAAGRPGWMTDRGRYYMILGEPASYDRFPGTLGINPCEVWYYYTDGTKNLPTHFGLIFFQKSGMGEFRLYDPFVDGPKALLQSMKSVFDIDSSDYDRIHDKIRELAPTLADIAVSLIPGEFGYGYMPTSRSTELIASVLQSPQENINPTYATHFFDYRGMVSTEYMTNYIDSDGLATVIRDPVLDLAFVHFTVVPQKLSLDYYAPKDQYFCNFKLDVSLRQGDTVVFQYSKEFPLYIAAADVERYRQNGVSFEDAFPVGEGDFKLAVLIQNTAGKEFSVFERPVSVPKAGGSPALNGPFLGYRAQNFPTNVLLPFKTLDSKLVVDPKMAFGMSEDVHVMFSVVNTPQDLWQNGEVEVALKGLSKTPVLKTSVVRLSNVPFNKVINLSQTIPVSSLVPDYYQLTLTLRGADKKDLDQQSVQFVVATEKAIAHPIANAKGFSLANQFYLYYELARQYDKMNLNDRAEAEFARGFSLNPNFKEGVSEYGRFLLKVGKYDQALTIIENLKDVEKGRYDYYLVKGLAAMGKADFAGAITQLLEANKIYNSDIVLLNALGSCFLKTEQKEEALNAYKASLKLNDKQEDIKTIVRNLEKK
jgi:GWxTD domain-containing protein